MAKYPQIQELYGPDWTTCPQIFAVVAAQLAFGYYLGQNASTPVLILCAYVIGGFATANLFLANHELSHNLAFKSPAANRLLGLVANLPIGIPFSVARSATTFLPSPYPSLNRPYSGLTNFRVIRSLSPMARYFSRSLSPSRKVGGSVQTPAS